MVRRQGGYTLVEALVAMTVGAIVMAAIFPIFLLLYRVETTWGGATQARVTGLIAEDYLVRDARVYRVVLDPDRTGSNILTLHALGTAPYSVTYLPRDSNLLRIVTSFDGTVLSQTVVAHGVEGFDAHCSGNVLFVGFTVDRVAGTSIALSPELRVTLRNPDGCLPG
jgi:prepilin-type N-terminal cleavage/methylation domain-containing protein